LWLISISNFGSDRSFAVRIVVYYLLPIIVFTLFLGS
jgi:hypothetical protein